MNYILILYNPCVKWIPCRESKGTYLAEMKKENAYYRFVAGGFTISKSSWDRLNIQRTSVRSLNE